MFSLRKLLALGSLFSVAACANVLGIEDTEVTASCLPGDLAYDGGNGPGEGPRNAGADQNFSCVGNLPTGQIADSDFVDITLVIVNLVNPTEVIEGLKIQACASRTDVDCTAAVEATSGADGQAVLTVSTKGINTGNTGYKGYFQISGKDSKGRDFIPYLQYFTRPILANRFFPVAVVTRSDLAGLFPEDKETASDLSTGVLAFQAVDCDDMSQTGAPNVRFSIADSCQALGPESREFYFSGDTPSTSVSSTQPNTLALGGFIGVKPGDMVVESYWNPSAQNLKTVRERVSVKAGWLTTLRFEPNQ